MVMLAGLGPELNLVLIGDNETTGPLNQPDAAFGWEIGSIAGFETLNSNQYMRNLSMDSGDLDGDGHNDEVVVVFRPAGQIGVVRLGIFEREDVVVTVLGDQIVPLALVDVAIELEFTALDQQH